MNLSELKNNLIVFTSTRKIREFKDKFGSGILPKTATLGEFFKKILIVENLNHCDEISQILFMKQACEQTKNLNAKLKIPSEFYEFMKNSDYLFKFFKELATQKKTIANLRNADTYAAYDEHLTILDELLKNYLRILRQNGVYDDISVCENYKINENFVREFDEICVYIDGFLSKFEFDIIESSAKFTNLKLIFKTSKLNKKMVEKISNLSGIEFEFGKKYEINLSTKSIEKCENLRICKEILVKDFSLRSLQCAYVFEKISYFVKCGISPKNIAVILPDEEFADILRTHDNVKMLNFAMGTKFEKTIFYQIILKISQCINENKNIKFYENITDNSVKNGILDEFSFFFHEINLSINLFEKIKSKFNQICEFNEFSEIVAEIINVSKNDKLLLNANLQELLAKPIFMIEKLIKTGAGDGDLTGNLARPTLKNIFEIFLLQSAKIKIPHTSGGEVSVLGALESRGMEFDGVIIIDFNDDLIPVRSSAEMFLSSAVRKEAGLISHADRENLQRFYYECLINSAKISAISYLSNEEKIPSRFLKHFATKIDDNSWDYLGIFSLENAKKIASKIDDEIIQKHDFFAEPLSFSRLNCYLDCKRKYYYKRIKKLSEDNKFNDEDNALMGNVVHESFEKFYKNNSKFDLEKLSQIFTQTAQNANLGKLDIKLMLLNFKNLAKEFENLQNMGFVCTACESELENEFCGVKIKGKIDRIDKNEQSGEYLLLDYKTGKTDTKSFQLAFYEALFSYESSSKFIFFKEGVVKGADEKFSKENLQEIIENLKLEFQNEVNFERKQNRNSCMYCPYKIVCKGEL